MDEYPLLTGTWPIACHQPMPMTSERISSSPSCTLRGGRLKHMIDIKPFDCDRIVALITPAASQTRAQTTGKIDTERDRPVFPFVNGFLGRHPG